MTLLAPRAFDSVAQVSPEAPPVPEPIKPAGEAVETAGALRLWSQRIRKFFIRENSHRAIVARRIEQLAQRRLAHG